MCCAVLNSLGMTELGLGYSRQKGIAHVKFEHNEGMQQVFSGWFGEKWMDAADVPKVEVDGWAHSDNMSTHAHAAVLYYAKIYHTGGWDDRNITKRGCLPQKPSSIDEMSQRGWPPSCACSTWGNCCLSSVECQWCSGLFALPCHQSWPHLRWITAQLCIIGIEIVFPNHGPWWFCQEVQSR